MALRLVRSAQAQDVPPGVLQFLRRHEEEEDRHLQQFEQLLGTKSVGNGLPSVPSQWCVLAVHLYGYEALGLEFARLLVVVRPDLSSILHDEARQAARAWRRRLPRTVDRYLHDETLAPFRDDLRKIILDAIDERFAAIRLT